MQEDQSLQQQNNDTEVLEETESQVSPVTFNQQNNNFHLTQQINPIELKELSAQDPELAREYLAFYKSQQEHNKEMDKEVIAIEKKEQQSRIDELPYQRKYAFRSLYFSIGISVLALGTAGYFAYLKYPILAGLTISVPIGVLAVNLINKKARTKLPEQKQTDQNDDNQS